MSLFVQYRIGWPGGYAALMVAIVDDDRSVRRAVRLLRSAGYTVETYGSARDFLAAEPEGRTAVALVDIKMEGMTGFELQEELAARHSAIPLIFITAFDDAATRDRIRRTGWECLEALRGGGIARRRRAGPQAGVTTQIGTRRNEIYTVCPTAEAHTGVDPELPGPIGGGHG
jgi:CheY-like chemotaxis protein